MADHPPDDAEERIRRLLEDGVDEGLFPGAVAAVGGRDLDRVTAAVGERHPERGTPATPETRFDLASLTKPIVTTTLVFQLLETGALTFDDAVADHVPELAGTERADVAVHELLTHTSGFQPYAYDETWDSREAAMADLAERNVCTRPPGEAFEYSCLNFVHLEEIVRRVTGEPMADVAERRLFEPAGMTGATMGPVDPDAGPIAVTYEHPAEVPDVDEVNLSGTLFEGTTHDPIARAFGGYSGNAGLFATVGDVATFGETILANGRAPGTGAQVLSPAAVRSFPVTRARSDDVAQGYGWRTRIDRTPAPTWSDESIGHTGFTGTSLWLDLAQGFYAVLLTNAVYADSDLTRFRKRFHALAAALATGRSADAAGTTERRRRSTTSR